MSAAEGLHTVTVTVDAEGLRDEVRFTCSGDRTARCHIYPDAESWVFGHEEADGPPHYGHDECWLQGWFDNDFYDYIGGDTLDDGGDLGVPHVARSGEIETEFDDFPQWWFVDGPVPA